MMTTGTPKVQMRHYKDFSLVPTLEQTYTAQSPDSVPQPVLDTAILGKGNYRVDRLVPLGSAWPTCPRRFCFELETDEDVVLVGYEYEYTTKEPVVAGVRA